MPESDEALLRRAAQTVRERAKVATQGPWSWQTMWCDREPGEPHHPNCEGTDTLAHWPVEELVHEYNVLKVPHDSWLPNPGDAEWIALFGPQLAEPLAAWLDDTAALIRSRGVNGVAAMGPPNHVTSALIVTRTLLGVSAVPAPVGDDHQEGQP